MAVPCWRGEGWPSWLVLVLRQSILIPICFLDQMYVVRTDPIEVLVAGLHRERAAFAHLHASNVRTRRLEGSWHDRSHSVPRLKASHHLLPHLVATREAVPVPVGSAVLASAGRLDSQCFEPAYADPRQFSHTQGIQRVRLLHAKARPIPSGPPTCPGADGKSTDPQGLHQLEARGIDGCCIAEGAFGLCLDLGVSKLGGRLVSLGLVAVVTAEHQIRQAVGAPSASRQEMVDLQGAIRLTTIDALIRVLEEQVRSGFPTCQFAPLILHARDFRVLKQLRVEAHLLDLKTCEGCPARESVRPGERVANSGEQAGCQPTSGDTPVVETGCAVAQVATPATSAGLSLPDFVLMNLVPSMCHFRQKERVMNLSLFHASQGDAGSLAARIDFEGDLLQPTLLDASVA